jgi:hypothetical protein
MAKCGIKSRSKVKDSIKRLSEKGLVKRDERKEEGISTSNLYEVFYDEGPQYDLPPAAIRPTPGRNTATELKPLEPKPKEQESQVAIATTAKPKWTEYASLIDSIKEVCKSQGWAYDGTQEKNFARHIFTAKDFAAQAETVGLSPQDYAIQIVRASALLDFWAGKVTGPKAIYQHHSKIYNAAKEFKRTQQPQNQFQTL